MAIESLTGSPFNRPAATTTAPKESSGAKQASAVTQSEPATTATGISLDMHAAIAAAGKVPTVNENRVAAIKSAIQNGSYTVNPERVADKMLQFDDKLPDST
jgi:negative regulator of flagellin synthesis FlgM